MLTWTSTAAPTAAGADPKAAPNPSPPTENTKPPCRSMVACTSASWRARASLMRRGARSHSAVEPSMSVNRKVTAPDGTPFTPCSLALRSGRSCRRSENDLREGPLGAVGRSSSDGVDPGDFGETGEVGVGAHHLESVLDAQRGEGGVAHQVRAQVELADQPAEDVAVASARLGHPGGRGVEPPFHEPPRIGRW